MNNTNFEAKYTAYISVSQDYIKGVLFRRGSYICLFMTALCKIKTINYDRLSSSFGIKANKNSSYRRIQSPKIFGLLLLTDILKIFKNNTELNFVLQILCMN